MFFNVNKLDNSLKLKMYDPAFLWHFCIYYLANQFEFAATHQLILLTAQSRQLKIGQKDITLGYY